jgi:hypothetical protein
LAIACWGDLTAFRVFDHSQSLVHRIHQVRSIPRPDLFASYQDFLQAELPRGCRSALLSLIRRSRRSHFRKRVRRRLRAIASACFAVPARLFPERHRPAA